MDFESHCKTSEALFGQRFEEVHHWLDEFAQKPRHRHETPEIPPRL